jgi:hypothetical protein
MNHKKLKVMLYGLIATVVIIALYIVSQQPQSKQQKSSGTANVISRFDVAETKNELTTTPKKNINIKSTQEKSNSVVNPEVPKDQLSYLDVYRQLQSARACQVFYKFWQQQGLEADVTKRVSRPHHFHGQQAYSGTEQLLLTTEQYETLEFWVSQCYQLWLDYGVFDGDKATTIPINDVKETIHNKLVSMVAKTPKERALKQTRRLINNWLASFTTLEDALDGEDSLDLTTAQILYDELVTLQTLDDEVKAQWFEAQANNHPNAGSFRDQHFDLLRQIRDLEFRIKEQKVVNHEKLNQAQLDFQGHDQAMNQAFRTKDGDVFFEIMYAMEGGKNPAFMYFGYKHQSNHGSPANLYSISPDQLVYEASGHESAVLHQWDLRYATHLYLCDLGWDCGPNSPIVMNYCLIGLGSYPDACGQSLPQFYQQQFLSPNHWQDVMVFKTLYQELFYE